MCIIFCGLQAPELAKDLKMIIMHYYNCFRSCSMLPLSFALI